MREFADRGEVLLVGRGGTWLLRDCPRAFHVRLVASMDIRLRRVMEYRWVREEVAKRLIAHSDAQRRSFCEGYFGVDWSSPLEYHITVNSGRLVLGRLTWWRRPPRTTGIALERSPRAKSDGQPEIVN